MLENESIYFDNAATTLKKPKAVAEAMYHALSSNQYGNPSRGAHDFSLNSFREVEKVRQLTRDLLGARDTYEVAFTHNATVALNLVIKGLLAPGDHVLTTTWEHNSVLRPLYQMEKCGVALSFVESTPVTGELDYDSMEGKIKPNTKAIIVNHASNVTGNVIDLAFVKKLCQKYGLLLIVDASQSMGQYPIDLSDEQVDILCFTGHKSLYGPSGTGGICLKKTIELSPLMTGGDGMKSFAKEQPNEYPILLEPGTPNLLGIIGLGEGIMYCLEKGVPVIHEEVNQLVSYFLEELKGVEGIQVYGNDTQDRTGVVSLTISSVDSAVLSDCLWTEYGIATRPGYHCAPLMHESLGTKSQGTVRFSFSSFNTKEEVTYAVNSLTELCRNR